MWTTGAQQHNTTSQQVKFTCCDGTDYLICAIFVESYWARHTAVKLCVSLWRRTETVQAHATMVSRNILCHAISSSPVTLVESDVVRCFSRINPNKAPGLDGLRGRVVKICAGQLGPFFTRFFQLLLNTHSVPRTWKQSTIMPIAKTPGARELNDFRPGALTSIIDKCMERPVCNQLIKFVEMCAFWMD